jgi:hypothetical protein
MSAQVGKSERGFTIASKLVPQERVECHLSVNLAKLAVARSPTGWGRVFGKVCDEQELPEERGDSILVWGVDGFTARVDAGRCNQIRQTFDRFVPAHVGKPERLVSIASKPIAQQCEECGVRRYRKNLTGTLFEGSRNEIKESTKANRATAYCSMLHVEPDALASRPGNWEP